MSDKPAYEIFSRPHERSSTGLAPWMRSLKEGDPQRIPVEFMSRTNWTSAMYRASKVAGFKVSIRTIDGEKWICRMKPQDVNGAGS